MGNFMFFLEYSAVGIASGGVYALIALGIVVIFKSSRTFNFAMGEMMMLSAYLFYTAAVTFAFGILAGIIASLAGRSPSRSSSSASRFAR